MRGDSVVVKRVANKRGGRAKAVVVYIAQRAFAKSIVYTKMSKGKVVGVNVKNEIYVWDHSQSKIAQATPIGICFKIDNITNVIEEVLGTLDDPLVDEKFL